MGVDRASRDPGQKVGGGLGQAGIKAGRGDSETLPAFAKIDLQRAAAGNASDGNQHHV